MFVYLTADGFASLTPRYSAVSGIFKVLNTGTLFDALFGHGYCHLRDLRIPSVILGNEPVREMSSSSAVCRDEGAM